jgi:hypothetical protein
MNTSLRVLSVFVVSGALCVWSAHQRLTCNSAPVRFRFFFPLSSLESMNGFHSSLISLIVLSIALTPLRQATEEIAPCGHLDGPLPLADDRHP